MQKKNGLPTIEKKMNENMKIHLWLKVFEFPYGTFPFQNIKQLRGNLFAIENDLGMYNFCFRPKWYQIIKFYSYYYSKYIINLIQQIQV